MKNIHHYYKRFRLSYIEATVIALIICAFLMPSLKLYEKSGENYYTIKLNGIEVGNTHSKKKADDLLAEARKRVVIDSGSNDLVFIDADVEIVAHEIIWGKIDKDAEIISNMINVLKENTRETLQRSYTVKINETSVNLASHGDVYQLLTQAIAPYNTQGLYDVELKLDDDREINVLEADIVAKSSQLDKQEVLMDSVAGIEAEFDRIFSDVEPAVEKTFEDYGAGVVDIKYADTIEVVEAYLMPDELISIDEAVNLLTKEQETQVIYKVKSGDTLMQIAMDNDIPMEELIAINDTLEDENTMIRVDQELLITVPEPDLSIIWRDEQVYTEDYEAEVQYIPNDNWYTTKKVTLQEPSAGRRKVAAVIEYRNGEELSREILKEEVYAEAVPKIVERGTMTPPTYIKPISGGRLSSRFGARSAPTKGASTYHKGVDWAVPTGTTVVASNGGTVAFAGWASGYGYAVYINHSDGRQTRYGHLSKVLVKSGQTVEQGQVIAKSGNTGRSTGPHLHFEIRIGGTAVDPLKHMN